MAVLSVWQPFVPLGNFGTVRWGQRLESTLVCLPGVVQKVLDVKGVWCERCGVKVGKCKGCLV